MKAFLAVCFFSFSGLAVANEIDLNRPPPGDFPMLKVIEHYVPQKEMHARCITSAWNAIACTDVIFERGEANIWFSNDPMPDKATVEHEYLHTKGYDHIGETTLHDKWKEYKERVVEVQKRIELSFPPLILMCVQGDTNYSWPCR